MNTTPKRDGYDIVVIGAGPAGLAATMIAAEAGLSTLLLDENAGPGGQVWRAIASTPVTERDRLGADYWAGADLVQAVRASGAEIIQRATVWSLDRHLEVGVSVGGHWRACPFAFGNDREGAFAPCGASAAQGI